MGKAFQDYTENRCEDNEEVKLSPLVLEIALPVYNYERSRLNRINPCEDVVQINHPALQKTWLIMPSQGHRKRIKHDASCDKLVEFLGTSYLI